MIWNSCTYIFTGFNILKVQFIETIWMLTVRNFPIHQITAAIFLRLGNYTLTINQLQGKIRMDCPWKEISYEQRALVFRITSLRVPISITRSLQKINLFLKNHFLKLDINISNLTTWIYKRCNNESPKKSYWMVWWY